MLVFKMSDDQTSDSQTPVVLVEQDGNLSTKSNKESIYRTKESKDNTHKNADPDSLSVVLGKQKDKEDDKKGSVVTNLPTTFKKWGPANETIELSPICTDKKSAAVVPPKYPTTPAPAQAPAKEPSIDSSDIEYGKTYQGSEDDFVVETVIKHEAEVVKDKHLEWSDDEEAGGLPRSDSRASRVSRVVRQMLCCGVKYEAASEENLETQRRHYSHAL